MKSLHYFTHLDIAKINIYYRWGAIALALCTCCILYLLQIYLPYFWLLQSLFILAGINIILCILHDSNYKTERIIQIGTIADTLTLTELLFLSGGVINPLASLYLIPVLIASLLTSRLFASIIFIICVLCYLLLFKYYVPITLGNYYYSLWYIHIAGMWFTFCLSSLIIVIGISQLTNLLKRNAQQLREAHQNQVKNEYMLWLGIQAANTAHELSTPLNNLYFLAEEFASDISHIQIQDVDLMKQQIETCIIALKKFKQDQELQEKEIIFESTFNSYLDKWLNLRPQIELFWDKQHPKNTIITINPLFWPAVFNILNNAADAGDHHIHMTTSVQKQNDQSILEIQIHNKKGTLNKEQLQQAGWISSQSNKPAGLGLGMQLSYASLEKIGATLQLSNHPTEGVLAIIQVPIGAKNETTLSSD